MFTQAELERANHDMQARLLAVSDQILRELSRLERQLQGAPLQVRASVLAAAAQIASTQQRVRDQSEQLPDSPLRRFEILRSSLEAQQGALRHLSMIVEAHAPAPRLEPAPPPTPTAPTAPPAQDFFSPPAAVTANSFPISLPEPPHDAAPALPPPAEVPPALPAPIWQNPASGWPKAPELHEPAAADAAEAAPARRGRLRGALEGAGARSLLLVAILTAGAVLSYGMFPRAGEPGDALPRTMALAPPSRAPAAAPPMPAPAAPIPAPQPQAQPPAPVRELMEETAQVQASPPAPAIPPPSPPSPSQPFMTGIIVGLSVPPVAPAAPAPQPAAPAPQAPQPVAPLPQLATGALPTKPQQAPAADAGAATPAPPIDPAPKPRFVPVVFTHKDDTEAKRAFADLQRQYPKLLGNRRGEAQAVDLGSKGVWHRLVVLPPGARPQATKLCDQLLGAGYDRCWVKAY